RACAKPLLERRKKRGIAGRLCLISIGSGRGNGRFGRVVVVVRDGGRGVRHAVTFAEPASQVDQAAAAAAKRPLGPFTRALALHPALADGTTHVDHRQLKCLTWNFSLPVSPLLCRLCRLWRARRLSPSWIRFCQRS